MWEISNYDQIIGFLLSLIIGALFCFVYDLIRAFRFVSGSSILAITIGDLVLWIFYAIITFVFLIATTNGEIRGYVLIGEFLGFTIFRMFFSKWLYFVFCFIFSKITFIQQKITDAFEVFYSKFELLISNLYKCLSDFFKSIKKLLKNTRKLLYTNKNILTSETNLNETKTKT